MNYFLTLVIQKMIGKNKEVRKFQKICSFQKVYLNNKKNYIYNKIKNKFKYQMLVLRINNYLYKYKIILLLVKVKLNKISPYKIQ